MASQLRLAEAQLIGFVHASKGYGINELAEAMGLTKSEWLKLRSHIDLKPSDKEALDKKFNFKP
jgi:plasmid maintenance system antidote protein VapI